MYFHLLGKTKIFSDVFLNIEEIRDIVGKYLTVFNGSQLSQDWRSFFGL